MRVSIITVTYNAEATVERTMQSVAMQTYGDIEHIVVDGASKDGTLDIVRRYNAKVVSEPDKGLYDAMNKGVRLATGDYLVFLNAGDKLHAEDTIERVVETAKKESMPGVIYGDTDIVDDEGKFLHIRRLRPPKVLTWKSFKSGMLVCHQSFYVRRCVAQEYDLKYRFSADFDWCIRCMTAPLRSGEEACGAWAKDGSVRTVSVTSTTEGEGVMATLTDYLSEGMTTANHKASLKERFRIMAKHYGWLSTVVMHIWFIFRSIIKK